MLLQLDGSKCNLFYAWSHRHNIVIVYAIVYQDRIFLHFESV